MNWINKLFGKTSPKPLVAPPPVAAKPPGEDVASLRGAVAAATGDERARLATRLGRALPAWSQAPEASDPPETWVAAICHAPDKARALAWIAGLQEESQFAEVARHAPISEVRYTAAQRLESNAALEQLAQASRDKDKRVYRHCSDLLRQRREAEARARRAREIGEEVGKLLAGTTLPQAHLLDLKKELAGLGDAGTDGAASNALLEQAFEQLHRQAQARRELQVRQTRAAALAEECSKAEWPWHAQLDGWRGRLAELQQEPAGLEAVLDAIAARLEAQGRDAERALACEAFLASLAADSAPDADQSAVWHALEKPEHAPARQALQAHWKALQAHAPVPVETPVEVPEVVEPVPTPEPERPRKGPDLAVLRALLDKMEEAIEQGHLADADTAAKQIKAQTTGQHLHGALESRLHALHGRLEQLRGWARWGTVQAREQLITAAQALLHGEHDVEELALAIPKLREEWKRLNAHGPAGKGQWESFDKSLEQAYQPVADFRSAQAASQAEAMAAKSALLAEWETEAAGIVWQFADFKVVEERRSQLIKQWREAPKAGYRDEAALRKRFDALIVPLDQHIDAARAAELDRREQIVAATLALEHKADLRQAMKEAKALQERWNQAAVPVRLKRSDEQQLWQRFRAACDAVFERNAAVRAEQATQRQERSQARQGMLDAFAASIEAADGNEVRQAVASFRSEWEAARPSGRDGRDELESQATELLERAQQRLDALRRDQHRQQLELLARKSALAERVEAAALEGSDAAATLALAQQEWDALPSLPAKCENLLARRFAAAATATREELEAGLAERESMLLDLEIILGLPSPEQFTAVRTERQLQRLQGRFGGAPQRHSLPEELLERWYATPSLAEADFADRIAAVVENLAAAPCKGK